MWKQQQQKTVIKTLPDSHPYNRNSQWLKHHQAAMWKQQQQKTVIKTLPDSHPYNRNSQWLKHYQTAIHTTETVSD